MIGEYSCPFLRNTGKAYGNASTRPKCQFHWKAKKRIPFSDCELQERLRLEMRERTFEELMVTHRDALTKLNITLCREYFHLIKLEEGEYCDSCWPE
ncbi:hypothetical protein RclHR1_17490001 [Rhizophagus clarus]|uniref:Uncharacterized protein n=1 Tax=Rhizophagus clarus TaxID=94130 RepID=A0A2Z6QLH9_9GLOM|nr:hypothetical protein RclHR1_17490001 [Rhizophagus clarus]GES86259.1 hypothetical protein GLOIN_2v1769754 [Rhizophagus clarus]